MVSAVALVSDFSQVSQLVSARSVTSMELRRDAYTRISLAVHYWKNEYFRLHPEGMNVARSNDPSVTNVWDALATSGLPTYSQENWTRYYPLFNEHLENVRKELQDALVAHADVLPPQVRSRIERTRNQLTADKTVYYWLPRGGLGDATPKMFQSTFIEVMRTLQALDAEVQELRDAL